MTDTPRVLDAVIRVSRRKGRKGNSFLSPTEQRDVISAWAERSGATIAHWWDETDSVSGKTTDREGLKGAMDHALSGKTDGVIVAKVDRFARSMVQGVTAVGKLRDAGKMFVAVKDGIEGEHASTPTGRMMLGILFLFAQWQLETLTEGWEAARVSHIGRGIANAAPYGYAKVKGQRLTPDPVEAEWVPKVYEHRAERWSWAKIADWLTVEGAKPRDGGGRWSVSSVKQLVENRAYLGEIRSGDDIVNTHAHDALVSLDLWQRANAVVTTKGPRREAEPYLLTGVVRCASCGVRMFGMTDHRTNAAGEDVTYRYYRCRGRHGSWGHCTAPARILADDAEAIVDAQFREAFLSDRVAVPAEATSEVEAAEAAVSDAEAELEAFVVNAAALDAELFARGVSVRQASRDEARQALAEARSQALGVALPVGLAEVWDAYTTEEKRPYIADAFAVVAVARGRQPAPERVRTWLTGDPSTPKPLPGVDGHAELTPIAL